MTGEKPGIEQNCTKRSSEKYQFFSGISMMSNAPLFNARKTS